MAMERCQKPEPENARACASDHHPPSFRSSLDYNTPLRSVRGDATSAPSPFYKLSAELSRESLRIPGAVPFMWEQSPGRRKFAAPSPPPPFITGPHNAATLKPPQASYFAPAESTSLLAVAPAPKPSLATLFRLPSFDGDDVVAVDMPAVEAANSRPDALPISSAVPQISPPPAADHPRTSSARYSVTLRNTPPGAAFYNASTLQRENNDDDDAAASEDATSDAVTATAGMEGLSIDDSIMLSGPLRPASTPSEARDFIMHRFLPAAHTIACESPQTPSRRFLQQPMAAGVGAFITPGSPSTCGSFRDFSSAACRPSPLRYASASSTPASNIYARQVPYSRGQIHPRSFHGEAIGQEEEEEEEEEDEEPSFTAKSCGIFPFHITISFHNRRSMATGQCSRRSVSSKHQHNKPQLQQPRNGCKSIKCASSPKRIMDILRDDQSSIGHEDESPAHGVLRTKHSEAERERIKLAVLEQAGLMRASNDRRAKPQSESYYTRESPNLHQFHTAQHPTSVDLYNEEGSEYGPYQDALSRFQSPSPAAFHANARALRGCNYTHAPLHIVNTMAHRARSFAGLEDDHTAAEIISTTEQHLLNTSFNYYNNMHSSTNNYKPHIINHPQLLNASPSSTTSNYPTPLSSHVGAPQQNCASYHENLSNNSDDISSTSREKANDNYGEIMSTNPEHWDGAIPHLPHKTHNIINNALFEHEEKEINIIASTKWSALNQAGVQGGRHGYGESKFVINADPQGRLNSHYAGKDDAHYVTNGPNPMITNANLDPHYVLNGHNPMNINANNHQICNGDMYVISANGDLHANYVNSPLPTSRSCLTPPLPKSPTHSWLDRTRPLVASNSNKRLGISTASSRLSHMHKASSRLSHMHKADIPPEDDYAPPVSMSKTTQHGSSETSKWEALVKGSHLQPGHLRFSEELYHQSQSVMKVGAT